MRTEFSLGSAKEACRDPKACRQWIYAAGEIKKDTPGLFLEFINHHKFAPHLIRFNPPGGNLYGAIALGRILREKEFDTEAEVCASACTYSFLGGIKRNYVDEKSAVGVHRFYNNQATKELQTTSLQVRIWMTHKK
jgi:hypothetical protein